MFFRYLCDKLLQGAVFIAYYCLPIYSAVLNFLALCLFKLFIFIAFCVRNILIMLGFVLKLLPDSLYNYLKLWLTLYLITLLRLWLTLSNRLSEIYAQATLLFFFTILALGAWLEKREYLEWIRATEWYAQLSVFESHAFLVFCFIIQVSCILFICYLALFHPSVLMAFILQ